MAQKIEIDVDRLHDLVYTWVIYVGIKQIPESMDDKSFKRGAFVFLDKFRELISEKKEDNK